ncbi:YbhN family protein [Hamadaea sp. NPDC051192]|uniref:lysylphosphatidylglycerol synthase transmembrane domain-containing protein n=1 Tax=Hamadaea sp. NPDC051192 TaxID=3154940 RepID=UPI00341CCED9
MSEAAIAAARPSRKWLRWAAYSVTAAIVFFVLRNRLPHPADVINAAHSVDLRWFALASVAQLCSLANFARQQRRLLSAFGVRMTLPQSMALTLSRSAIAISLPAGSAVSAAFAFQQFRAKGASKPVATAVMVLSGVMSFVGLGVLYLIGGTVTGLISLCVGAASLVGLTALVVVLWRRWNPTSDGRIARLVRSAHDVAPRHWLLALLFAVVNWFADLLCLFAVARSFDVSLSIGAIAATYLGVQIVRQIPLTPGGIGVIETGLLAGLVGAGAASAPAAATVLGYRVLSCWLIIPVGFLAWTALRRAGRAALDAVTPALDVVAPPPVADAEPEPAPV